MMPKVLLLQGTIKLYRIPIYNLISQNVDLTVAYTDKNESIEKQLYKTIKLDYKRIIGFFINTNGFFKICSQFDILIFMSDLHYLSYCSLPFIRRKYKVIAWSIGIRASYSRRYDVTRKKDFIDMLYGMVLKNSDAVIFYMKAPIKFWGSIIDLHKVFIAHNTVKVSDTEIKKNQEKNRILFIGSLYKEKKIYELIESYIEAKMECKTEKFLYLDIIGKGPEYANIKASIDERGLAESIILHGPIYDEKVLAHYFSKSLICVSPDQAGLSVLKSMGNGVPFVTRINAITGGERLNIINQVNGVLYNSQDELRLIIEEAFNCPEKYITMGKNAHQYYLSNATPEKMAQGAIDAINFVVK